jgi:hypothetical protein
VKKINKKSGFDGLDVDAKVGLSILVLLATFFFLSALFGTGITGHAVYNNNVEISDLFLNPFFVIMTFLLLVVGIYSYERNLLVPITKLCNSAPVNVKPEQRKLEMPKPVSKVKQDKKESSFLSFVLANKSTNVKQNLVKVLTPEQSFDKLIADTSKKIGMPGFDVIRASEMVSKEFSRLPLDVQDRKLNKFLSFHKKLEDSVK